jgi:tRNA (cytidine/uridine-2'-O-)-methyltransferase
MRPMFHVVLHEPEIPPNTGNVIRLCANTGASLHLIQPLGFDLDRRSLRRAGLDYHLMAAVTVHDNFAACRQALAGHRWFAIETGSDTRYDRIRYQAGDVLLFGSETRGLPTSVLEEIGGPPQQLSIPMQDGNRSLNLANAVAVVVYEAWRQVDFAVATVNQSRP